MNDPFETPDPGFGVQTSIIRVLSKYGRRAVPVSLLCRSIAVPLTTITPELEQLVGKGIIKWERRSDEALEQTVTLVQPP